MAAGSTAPNAEGAGAEQGVYPALHQVLQLARERDVGVGRYPVLRRPAMLAFPRPAAVDAARRWAKTRQGHVAFAVADRSGIAGFRSTDPFPAASLVKAMILVAYLGRLDGEHRPLTPGDVFRVDAMIRVSDNDSATALFHRLGPGRLRGLARRAGMRAFEVGPSWSEASVTAADQARFFHALNRLLPPRRRDYARYLLSSVQPLQSWGIPQAARSRWQVFFKGGWRPDGGGQLVHQAALIERGRRRVGIAILTEGNPSEKYGQRTVRGIARRLLSRSPAEAPVAPAATPGRLSPLEALSTYQAPEPRPLRRFSS
jgi:beta-lactamase class A